MISNVTVLQQGQFLTQGQFLQSQNEIYYATVDRRGNLIVFFGMNNEDQQNIIWSSESTGEEGDYFLYLNQYGLLSVIKGTSPEDALGYHWTADYNPGPTTDGIYSIVVCNFGSLQMFVGTLEHPIRRTMSIGDGDDYIDTELISVDYELNQSTVIAGEPLVSNAKNITNDSPANISTEFSFSQAVLKKQTWSFGAGIKIGAKTTIETKLPYLIEGKLELSAEISINANIGGETSETITVQQRQTISIPPFTSVNAVMKIEKSKIIVPYVLNLLLIYKSGKKVPVKVNGIFTGDDGYYEEILTKGTKIKPAIKPESDEMIRAQNLMSKFDL